MFFSATFRWTSTIALAALVVLAMSGPVTAQPMYGPPKSGGQVRPLAIQSHQAAGQAHAGQGQKQQNQEHLAQWMDRHSNLPLKEQQDALENEPGFKDLPPQTQQRMRDRLTQLNNMSPEQRRRILERTEAMEQLTPPQRQQVRGALQQFKGLPTDRRRLVARAFRDLREMPQPQRQEILNSDRFRGQFSDQERNTLSSLLAVEPYLPVQRANDQPEFGR
jgi:hypothetical protein